MNTVKRRCEKCGEWMDWDKGAWSNEKHTCDSCLGAKGVLADIANQKEN